MNHNNEILFLDDIRPVSMIFGMIPDHISNKIPTNRQITLVKSYEEFILYIINRGIPDFVSFDHDLSYEHYESNKSCENFNEKTGYDCVKWLIDHCLENKLRFPDYYVHSMNIIGKENIDDVISSYKKHKNNINYESKKS
jgi:hypothetical protein